MMNQKNEHSPHLVHTCSNERTTGVMCFRIIAGMICVVLGTLIATDATAFRRIPHSTLVVGDCTLQEITGYVCCRHGDEMLCNQPYPGSPAGCAAAPVYCDPGELPWGDACLTPGAYCNQHQSPKAVCRKGNHSTFVGRCTVTGNKTSSGCDTGEERCEISREEDMESLVYCKCLSGTTLCPDQPTHPCAY
jgi:hypothetical protein